MSLTYADAIFLNGRIATLDPSRPEATALAVTGDRILAVGSDKDISVHQGPKTQVVDLGKHRVIPGLIDSHIHVIGGGLNYNMELRWDGVDSLSTAMRMLKEQVDRTPAPQWVRVVGGFTEHQFAEKRLPTLDEINRVAPETPVFILHLYDRALLNRAALRVCGYTKETKDPPGGQITRDGAGNPTGLLLAKPNAMILYATLAKGPKLPFEYQVNSTRHFMRELNRLGVTGVIDAGGGFQNYPEDYEVINQLANKGELTLRIAYNLFTQKPKEELSDFKRWTEMVQPGQGSDYFRHNGAGEMLVFSAADFEDFREPRPDLAQSMEDELEKVVRLLVEKRWPFRLHATYDETITRALTVFERVNRDIPFDGLHWFFDHAETISMTSIDRVKQLGGGIAVQHRMAYQGEYFVERYGAAAADRSPPVKDMLHAGLPVGAGTDATRVASYNPWMSLSWLVTGKTVGGLKLYSDTRLLDRETALRLWTVSNTWFSNEEGKRGQIKNGQLADFAVLSDDYFGVDGDAIKDITSWMTVVGGRIVHGDGPFSDKAPNLPPPMPDWSPIKFYGGYQSQATRLSTMADNKASLPCCSVHPIRKTERHTIEEAALDWSMGCMCWAF
ncbi:MAG TPA: amidohydrolase [Oligoflexus sp.]|uniref:amidohydrolase n=1 Tax=Oligoflexus sp. TaxID=1971216 RepID=UPI002D706A59|nr:amidohydrolase [Oligoflexus sp.]HYX37789.1 amidohydrolase [Oligoflexus sp.]